MTLTRRELLGGAAWVALAAPLVRRAQGATFREGVNYARLAQPMTVGDGKHQEVAEMFSYRCPHCFHFEPTVEKWLQSKPANVDFYRVPVGFGRSSWQLLQRVYYAVQEIGALNVGLSRAIFAAIHVQGKPLANETEIVDFLASQGVDKARFKQAFGSFAVQTRVKRAQQLVMRYQIDGVPSLIVDGSYKITGQMAGSNDAMLEVAEFLLKQNAEQYQAAASSG